MRYLGLDIGRKHIGVAAGEVLAQELITLTAARGDNFYDQPQPAYRAISKLLDDEHIDAIVAGLPVDEQGAPTAESAHIDQFCQGLERTTNLTVHFVDETLTSFMAEDMLASQGLPASEAKQRVHQLAAELILQQYLEDHVG